MMLYIFAISLLLPLSLSIAGDPCPPKAALAPCTCEHLTPKKTKRAEILPRSWSTTTLSPRERETLSMPYLSPTDSSYTRVDCKVIKSISHLTELVISALDRKLVDKLVVENVPPQKEYTLARLPSGWLKRVRVRHFEVLNSRLSGDFIWYGNPFEGQTQSLLWFAANRCFLTGALTYNTSGTINTKGLDSLPRIEGVDFSHNYLTVVTSDSFQYPPTNLSSVILSHNSINEVESESFGSIKLLKHVNLSHNLLESVVRSMFASPAEYLEEIDLSWNSLTVLPTDFFEGMPSLKFVNMSNNFLYSLPEKPWSTIWSKLKNIDLLGNFVECNCDLLWLLPIISPSGANDSTTPVPAPLAGQNVSGICSRSIQKSIFAVKYDLVTLTRDRLACS